MFNRPKWLFEVLYSESFTSGELQGGTYIDIDPITDKPLLQSRHVRGTGIPASTLTRIREGAVPGPVSLKKLKSFYQRYKYAVLREANVPRKEAKKYSRRIKLSSVPMVDKEETGYSIRKVHEFASRYNEAVRSLAEEKTKELHAAGMLDRSKSIDPAWVMRGLEMQSTIKNVGDIEVYVKRKKFKLFPQTDPQDILKETKLRRKIRLREVKKAETSKTKKRMTKKQRSYYDHIQKEKSLRKKEKYKRVPLHPSGTRLSRGSAPS